MAFVFVAFYLFSLLEKNTALCQKGKKVVGILVFLFIKLTDLCFVCVVDQFCTGSDGNSPDM